jgi:hypothetical protein
MLMVVSREVILVPPVGDGNPSTAFALARQAEYQGMQVETFVLSAPL